MIQSKYFSFFLCCFCLWGCGDIENRGIENRQIAEEIANREIKHITPAQITETAFRQGNFILDTINISFTKTMQEAVQNKSIAEAAAYCNLQLLKAANDFQNDYQAAIQRIRLKGKRKGQQLNGMEAQLLEAYQYNTEKNLPLEHNVQQSGSDYLLFTAPLTINDQVCLKCHGKIGEELDPADYKQLKTTYEMDSLVNYSLNQPIAILSIMLQRKEVIKRISVK